MQQRTTPTLAIHLPTLMDFLQYKVCRAELDKQNVESNLYFCTLYSIKDILKDISKFSFTILKIFLLSTWGYFVLFDPYYNLPKRPSQRQLLSELTWD